MKKKVVLYVVFLWMTIVSSVAQEAVFRNFSSIGYRGGTQNWCVEQLPSGQVAFANNNGLLLFDGERWELHPIVNYSTVRALRYSKGDGRLYAGASNEFGYYATRMDTYLFEYHSISDQVPSSMRGFGEIWNIVFWQGQLVFQGKNHLFIYNVRMNKLRCIHSSVRIESLVVSGGRLLVGTHDYLGELRGNHIEALPGGVYPSRWVVRAMCLYRGKLLVATQQNGLYVYEKGRFLPFVPELSPLLSSNQVFCMALWGNKLALGTVRAGLIVRDLSTGVTQYVNASQGLQNNTVLSVAFDYRGSIWLGLDNGVSYAMLDAAYSNIVSERNSIGTGYTSLLFGNYLYLGTNQGLYMNTMPLGQQMLSQVPAAVSGIVGQVWCIDRIGDVLLCGTDRGLFRVSAGKATQIEGLDGTWRFCELKRHPGYIVATDYQGMVLLKKVGDSYQMAHRVKIPVDVSGNLYEDSDGTLWMSNWLNGIYRLQFSADLKSMRLLETFNAKNQLLVDQGNNVCRIGNHLYVSSVDGFYRYDHAKRKLVYDKAFSKIFDTYGEALHLQETPNHDIWAQKVGYLAIARRTARGYEVDSMSYRPIVKNQQLGLANMTALDAQTSVINGNNGFYLVKNHYVNRLKDYPLSIGRIIANSDGDTVVYRTSLMGTKEGDEPHVKLAKSLNSIRIEFAMPEFQTEDAVTYQCLLENYDDHWRTAEDFSKEYSQLPKGTYVFRVKAFSRLSGKVQEAKVKITILPAWYETFWAYLVYVGLFCLLIYYVVKYLVWRSNRELKRKQILNERKMQIEMAQRKAEVAEMKSEQLQTELKHKSSELASSTMNLIHQNDILQKLDEGMVDLAESVRREDKKAVVTGKISTIRNDLQSCLNNDEGWDKFEENFNLVYDDFMKKLTSRYTTLKMSDRKLCAYLRMGLNSKDMASLLNMSVRSIETARYRLRKKLQLEAGENLTEFIQNFGKDS